MPRNFTLCALTMLLLGPALSMQAATLSLSAPLSRAVFQRDAANQATVPVAGTLSGDVTRLEARAIVMDGFTGISTGWQVIASEPSGETFRGQLHVPAGGWYRIETRALDGPLEVAQSSVERVGVGEVFVTAGQSNSANHGDNRGANNRQQPVDDRVSAYDGNIWRIADDPQPIATGGSGSPWPALGDIIAAAYDVPVAFYSVGWGGTSVGQWVPGASGPDSGPLYDRLQAAVQNLGAEGFRAVLWHQGESDNLGNTSTADYAARLESVIAQSRVDAGFDVPWGVALVSYVNAANPLDQQIVDGQLQVIANDSLVFQGPNTDTMVVPYRGGSNFTGIHFNEDGLREHARRWFHELRANGIIVPEPASMLLLLLSLAWIPLQSRRCRREERRLR